MLNWFDLVILTILLLALFRGYVTGFIKQAVSLLGVVLGAFLAGKLAPMIADKLVLFTDAGKHIISPVSYIFAFLIIYIIVFFVGRLLQSFVKALKLNALNRFTGAVFCSLKWFLVISLLLNILISIDPDKNIIHNDIREQSYSYPHLKNLVTYIVPYLKFDWLDGLNSLAR